MLGRITPDYSTLKVYKDGKELVADEDYRLYISGFHMYSDDHDPAHAADISSLMALRDRIQHTWWPYYTFGLIFSNDLMPTVSTLAQANQTPQSILQLLRSGDGQIRGLEQAAGNATGDGSQYGPDSIVITYKAKLDTNAFLVDDDGAGHGIEANGMPVRLVSQSNEVMLGYSAMDAAEFEALIGGAGGDGLPRFAGAENVDVKAIEESGVFPGLDNTSENTQDAESNIRDTDVATDIVGDNARGMVIQQNMRPGFSYSDPFLRTASVYNYGFDIAKLDESGKLLQGGTFDVRTGPEDGASAMEFVPVEWMDGSNNEAVFPEGPVYRIAVDGDDPEVRTAEIEAGKAIVVGLDSGTYYVAEKKAPSGYLRDAEPHSVRLLSLSDFMAGLRADYAEEMVEFSKDNILAQAGQAMLGQANQVPDGTYTVVYKAVDGSRTEGLATNADLPWTELCRDEDVAFLDEVSWGGVKERHGLEDPAPYVLDGETYTWQGTWKSSWNDGLTVRTYEAVYGTGPVSAKNLERLSSGYRVNRAGDDAAGLAISEKMRSQINGKRQAWCNMIPIQVDGGGIYDLSDLGIKEKVFSGMALFDKTDDGEYKYGNTSLTLQVGANVDQKLQGTLEAPLKGGLPVTNLPGLELPKTGGAGTVPYIIFGSMMVLLSGLLLADRKRHR